MSLSRLVVACLGLTILVACGSGSRCERACDDAFDECLDESVPGEICNSRRQKCEAECSDVDDEGDTVGEVLVCVFAAILGGECNDDQND